MSEPTQEIVRWTASIAMAVTIFGAFGYLYFALRKIDKENQNKKAS